MRDEDKTQRQFTAESDNLRQWSSELETPKAEPKRTEEASRESKARYRAGKQDATELISRFVAGLASTFIRQSLHVVRVNFATKNAIFILVVALLAIPSLPARNLAAAAFILRPEQSQFEGWVLPSVTNRSRESVTVRTSTLRSEVHRDETGFTIHDDRSMMLTSAESAMYVPDEVVLKLRPPYGTRGDLAIQTQQLQQQVANRHGFARIVPVLSHSTRTSLKLIHVAHLDRGVSPIEACERLQADPAVEWAEPNYYYRHQFSPNDPYYSSAGSWGQSYMDMWGLHAINPEDAWEQTQGDGIIVAVIDTGVDYNHEEWHRDSNGNDQPDSGEQYNIWINVGEDSNGNGVVDPTDFNGIDDDGNGFIDDVRGWNFIDNSNNPMDDHGHGSHCAGIIAAIGQNNAGIIGVAPSAKIMVVKSLDSNGTGTATQVADGIVYAVNAGAHVLSNSWGGGGESQLIAEAIDYARGQNRVVVAAAGNLAVNAALHLPANIKGVLTVAALDPNLELARFSNFGSVVDFAAPGVDVLSLRAAGTDMYGDGDHFVPNGDPNAQYYRADGTSMACPFAAGVSALLLAQNPSLSETAVRRAIAASASRTETASLFAGTGLVNAGAALEAVDQVSDVAAAILRPADDSEVLPVTPILEIIGTADGDSYALEWGKGYYPDAWHAIATGVTVEEGLLGTLDLADKQGPHQIRLSVSDGPKTAVEYMPLWPEPDLHVGWPVRLGGSYFEFGGLVLGGAYHATPADADQDGADEIFVGTIGHTFGLRGDGTFLPGWPARQLKHPAYLSNASYPGPSVADVDNKGSMEILWTQRDYWRYPSDPDRLYCFNGKNLDGSNMDGFPQQAMDESSNAFALPFILADLDRNGTLEAIAAHTKGNNFEYYRISAFDSLGNRLFTHDFEDENESIVGLSFGNLDGSGEDKIVAVSRASYQNGPVYLNVVDHNGNKYAGYPVFLYHQSGTDTVAEAPFLADLDNDGDLEVVLGISGYQSAIHVYHHDGTPAKSFPAQIGDRVQILAYGMGDVNDDDDPEIVVLGNYRPIVGVYRVYVMDLNGQMLPGWPFEVEEWPTGRPAVVDVDNDGQQDICFTTESGSLYACSGDGQLVPGFPKKMSFKSTSGVSVGDVDGDGLFELLTGNMIGRVYVWDLPTTANRKNTDWPMRNVNARNTNVFGDTSGSDVALFAAEFGRTDCIGNCEEDLDTDGDVDGSDLATFAAGLGE